MPDFDATAARSCAALARGLRASCNSSRAIHSTNTHAMAAGEAGAPDGMVYFADEQTAGRGRGAHEWSSPPGSGLYVSVLLRPRMAPADVLWLSLAAGLAVRDAVHAGDFARMRSALAERSALWTTQILRHSHRTQCRGYAHPASGHRHRHQCASAAVSAGVAQYGDVTAYRDGTRLAAAGAAGRFATIASSRGACAL